VSNVIATSSIKAVIGTGVTGLSVARFLSKANVPFVLLDTRDNPPNVEAIKKEFPHVRVQTGALSEETLLACDEIIVSPGVAIATPAIAKAQAAGISVVGDIELLIRHAKAPIIAITGSNAKSTVTTLVGEMAIAAGLHVAVGGNLGTPALELLRDDVQLYVLELSSFQLETITTLNAKAATILNISEDHLDRYTDMRAYILAKMRVYFGAENIIVNRNDVLTQPPLPKGKKPVYFGGPADFGAFGIIRKNGEEFLAQDLTALMPVNELKIAGRHNIDNALAALALGSAAGLPMNAMLDTLKVFAGLRHRCEWVETLNGVDYYNDSKGTNIGATLAAIKGLSRVPQKLIVIVGGEGKDQNFKDLAAELTSHNCHLVLMGRDASIIGEACKGFAPIEFAASLQDAVDKAQSIATAGDAILLSPACASFDMFKGYADRGEQFCSIVRSKVA
jgi:UDP-N-acetylmuramoylalanine--D-glutamate ligase